MVSTLLLLIAGFGIGWAGNEVYGQREVVNDDPVTYVRVEAGVVESSQSVNALARWPRKLIASNTIPGTVTKVFANTAELVQPGAVLYEVNLTPVIALTGNVPSFRELNEGTLGEDVAQVQTFLETEGYLFSYEPGYWGYSTTAALKAWQKDNSLEASGVLLEGQVVFIPNLPARITLDSTLIKVGAVLAGNEEAIFTLSDDPSFQIPLTDAQAGAIPIGVKVLVNTAASEPWEAWVVESRPASEEGGTDLILGADPDETESQTAICGSLCSEITTDKEGVLLRSKILLVEETSGMLVPSAAITTDAEDRTFVFDDAGTQHEVTVLAGARGFTAVEGLTEGMKVRAPAEDSQ